MRVFILCTHSVAGALPLGVVITRDKQMETLTVAFSLLKSIFPEDNFFGKKMPDVIMTDNCSELRGNLSEVFPTSNLLLCNFHTLQQVWRWLFDKKHGILANDEGEIMRSLPVDAAYKRNCYIDELAMNFFQFSSLMKYPSAVLLDLLKF